MLAKKRLLGLLVIFLVLAGAGWWLSHSRLPTATPTQTSSTIPRIEFRAPQASVSLDSTPTTQQALEVILQEIGYEQSWHFFYLPHELNPVSLEPDKIVLEFLPLSQYQPQLQPHLVERAVDNQGQLLSGTSCQYQLESNTLSCTLFSSYDLAQPQPNQLEPDQYITFATTSTLLLLSKQIGQVRSQELGFTRLHQRLTEVLEAHHYQLVIINQFESSHLLVPRWLSWLEWLKPSPVWAQSNPCGGEPLECKVVQEVCTCPSGEVCNSQYGICTTNGEVTECADHCVRYCNGPWEISDPFWCKSESWDGNACRDPYAGTCGERWAGDTEGMYCATRGDCYPVTGPSTCQFTPDNVPPTRTPHS